MITKLLILFVFLAVCPPVIGSLFTSGSKGAEDDKEAGSFPASYLYGLLTMLALFQVMAIPLCMKKARLSTLSKAFIVLCVILMAAGAVRSRLFKAQRRWLFAWLKALTPVMGAAMLCMLLQAGYVTQMQHMDADDAYYLATAVTAVEKDGLYTHNPNTGKKMKEAGYVRYMLASWPVFIAVLSQTSGMHATVLAHMVLPAVVLFWCYLAYFMFAGWLYTKDPKKEGWFMLFITALFAFSGYSIYASTLFPLIRGWQGKAVLAGMGLPLLLLETLKVRSEEKWNMSWVRLMLIVAGISAFTTIADVFGCIVVGAGVLPYAIKRRSLRPLVYGAAACLPLIILGIIYLLRMKGYLQL